MSSGVKRKVVPPRRGRLILEIDIRERLSVVVADGETRGLVPRRTKVVGSGAQSARGWSFVIAVTDPLSAERYTVLSIEASW
jgi:hypothetical protein